MGKSFTKGYRMPGNRKRIKVSEARSEGNRGRPGRRDIHSHS